MLLNQNKNNIQNLNIARPSSNQINPKYVEPQQSIPLTQFYKFQNNFSDPNIMKGMRKNQEEMTSFMPPRNKQSYATNPNQNNRYNIATSSMNLQDHTKKQTQMTSQIMPHKQVQNGLQFQFKRTSLPSNRGGHQEQQKRYLRNNQSLLNHQQINNIKQLVPSKSNQLLLQNLNNLRKQQILQPQQIRQPQKKTGQMDYSNGLIQNNRKQNDQKISSNEIQKGELIKQMKLLQSQLKFEQKYANDIFKNLQQSKKQNSEIKRQNAQINTQLSHQKLKFFEKQKQIQELQQNVAHKSTKISHLQKQLTQSTRNNFTLQKDLKEKQAKNIILKERIQQMFNIYKNELYQQRIKKLNDEILKINTQLSSQKMEKRRLMEENKIKTERITILQLDTKQNNHHGNFLSNVNANQSINSAINHAFQNNIRIYQQDIQNLKNVIENNQEEHKKIREEIADHKKEISSLKEEIRINHLKFNIEKNNLEKENSIILKENKNQISSITNRYKVLQQKYSKSLKEINEKDNFLQEHLVGRAKDLQLKEYIEKVINTYKQTFDSRNDLQERIKELEKKLAGNGKIAS